jgi:hypothetical protein
VPCDLLQHLADRWLRRDDLPHPLAVREQRDQIPDDVLFGAADRCA